MNEGVEIDKFWRFKNPLMWGTLITFAFFSILFLLGTSSICETTNGTEVCQNKFKIFLNSPPNEIGDTLAGIAGALAFLWIIVTVLLQSQELKAQRNELALQRNELELNRLESEKTAKALSQQVFDNAFFSILDTHNSIVGEIDIANSNKTTTTGRDCFGLFYRRLSASLRGALTREEIQEGYTKFWQRNQSNLGHYYRFLYRAFLKLSEDEATEEYHPKLLRSLLSDQELAVLFYNCLFEHGANFLELAVEFEIFDNLPFELLVNPKHSLLVPEGAFGNNLEYKEYVKSVNGDAMSISS